MKLSDIADNAGSRKKRMRVGRGIGSGKGKQSGGRILGIGQERNHALECIAAVVRLGVCVPISTMQRHRPCAPPR